MDFDSDGNYVGGTTENLISFGVSMGLNFVGGGVAGSTARSAFKASGSEVMQITSRNAVVDSKGLYASTITRNMLYLQVQLKLLKNMLANNNSGLLLQKMFRRYFSSFAKSEFYDFAWDNRNNILNFLYNSVNNY